MHKQFKWPVHKDNTFLKAVNIPKNSTDAHYTATKHPEIDWLQPIWNCNCQVITFKTEGHLNMVILTETSPCRQPSPSVVDTWETKNRNRILKELISALSEWSARNSVVLLRAIRTKAYFLIWISEVFLLLASCMFQYSPLPQLMNEMTNLKSTYLFQVVIIQNCE